jgi:hypothetical protein
MMLHPLLPKLRQLKLGGMAQTLEAGPLRPFNNN